MDLKHLEIVNEIARVAHEVNAAYARTQGDDSHLPWHQTSVELRQSAQAGVIQVLKNPGITAELIHKHWLHGKLKDGWAHGEVKDLDAKTHPCMVEWPFLPPAERVKDELFVAVVRALYPQ